MVHLLTSLFLLAFLAFSTAFNCDNKCGPAVKNEYVSIVVRNGDGKGSAFEGKSPYIHQLTVSLAMRNLVNSNQSTPFNFESKFYLPYGDFVTSINGVKPGADQYWELFVNGESSQCGMDTRVLELNDVVQWSLASTK